MSQAELVTQIKDARQPQMKPAELNVAALREEYSAMRKRLAETELQIDKMRFRGADNDSKQLQEEPLHQVASSLRQKLEMHYDHTTETTSQNKERREHRGVNLRGSCTADLGQALTGERKTSRGNLAANVKDDTETSSEASDGDASSIEGGSAPAQVVEDDEDNSSCGSRSLSGTSLEPPDVRQAVQQPVRTGTISQPHGHLENVQPDTSVAVTAVQRTDAISCAPPLLGSYSETAPLEQAVVKETKSVNNASSLHHSGVAEDPPLTAALQRKARMESRQLYHLLAMRRLEGEIASLKEGLGSGGLPLGSIVSMLTKVCTEHRKLANEVTTQSSIATGYSTASRENMMDELRTLGWHIGELEEQLRKKRIATQEPTPASNDSNMSKSCYASEKTTHRESGSRPKVTTTNPKEGILQKCKDGDLGDSAHTAEDPSTVEDHSTVEDYSHTEDHSHTGEDHSHTAEDPSHTETPSHTAEDPTHTAEDPSHTEIPYTAEVPSHTAEDHPHTADPSADGHTVPNNVPPYMGMQTASAVVTLTQGENNEPKVAVVTGAPEPKVAIVTGAPEPKVATVTGAPEPKVAMVTGAPEQTSHTAGYPAPPVHNSGYHLGLGKSAKRSRPSSGSKQKDAHIMERVSRQVSCNQRDPEDPQTVLGMVEEEEEVVVQPSEQSLVTSQDLSSSRNNDMRAAIDALKTDLAKLRQDITSSIAENKLFLISPAHATPPSPASYLEPSHPRPIRCRSATYSKKAIPPRPHSSTHSSTHHIRSSSVYASGNPIPVQGWPDDYHVPPGPPGSSGPKQLLRRASVSNSTPYMPSSVTSVPPTSHGPSHHQRSQSWSPAWMSAAHPDSHSTHPDSHSTHPDSHSTHPDSHSTHPDSHSTHPYIHSAHTDDESANHKPSLLDSHIETVNLRTPSRGCDDGGDITSHPNWARLNNEYQHSRVASHHEVDPIHSSLVSNQGHKILPFNPGVGSHDADLKDLRDPGHLISCDPLSSSMQLSAKYSVERSHNLPPGVNMSSEQFVDTGVSPDDAFKLSQTLTNGRTQLEEYRTMSEPQAASTPVWSYQDGGHLGYPDQQAYQMHEPGSRRIVAKKQPYTSNAWSDAWIRDRHFPTNVEKGDRPIQADVLGRAHRRRRHTHDSHMSGQYVGVTGNAHDTLSGSHNGKIQHHLHGLYPDQELDLSEACQLAQSLDERCQRMKRTLDRELSVYK